jgi:poly-gamma-glutamate synthesis protein (capsule biosynthesis protein)
MTSAELVLRDIGERFHAAGFFDASSIQSYIVANPDALFVTDKEIASGPYSLKRTVYRFSPVAVVNRDCPLETLSGALFDRVLLGQKGSYGSIAERVARGALPVGVIPLETLSLELKPLKVDGVFPSIGNIQSGSYPRAVLAFVYTREGGLFSSREDILGRLSGPAGDVYFSVIGGGDVMLARGAGAAVASNGTDYPFREIKRELERHDIACANLESPISARGKKFSPDKGIYFRADPGVLRGIAGSGLDFLSLANNHSLDWGPYALADTMNALDDAGIRYAGAGTTADEAFRPAVFTVRGTSVAFIAINDVYPIACSEPGTSAMTFSLRDKTLDAKIRGLNAGHDVLIASVHAGMEYDREQEEYKERAFRHLVDLGVDVVFGHHPHVVQGIEIYRGRVIAYSLGNFIFDQSWSAETSEGLLLEVGFTGERPIYCNAMPISIQRAQARLLEPAVAVAERELL